MRPWPAPLPSFKSAPGRVKATAGQTVSRYIGRGCDCAESLRKTFDGVKRKLHTVSLAHTGRRTQSVLRAETFARRGPCHALEPCLPISVLSTAASGVLKQCQWMGRRPTPCFYQSLHLPPHASDTRLGPRSGRPGHTQAAVPRLPVAGSDALLLGSTGPAPSLRPRSSPARPSQPFLPAPARVTSGPPRRMLPPGPLGRRPAVPGLSARAWCPLLSYQRGGSGGGRGPGCGGGCRWGGHG